MDPDATIQILMFFLEQAAHHAIHAAHRSPKESFGIKVLCMHAELFRDICCFCKAVNPFLKCEQGDRAALGRACGQLRGRLREADELMQELDVPDDEQCANLADAFAEYVEMCTQRVAPTFSDLAQSINAGPDQDRMSWFLSVNLGVVVALDAEKSVRRPLLTAAEPFDRKYVKMVRKAADQE